MATASEVGGSFRSQVLKYYDFGELPGAEDDIRAAVVAVAQGAPVAELDAAIARHPVSGPARGALRRDCLRVIRQFRQDV